MMKFNRIIVTAGPTREAIDPVRYLSNHSSGKQGYAIADAFVKAGAKEVILVSGPTEISPPANVRYIEVQTATEMLAACEASLPADIVICAAAVCDWRMKTQQTQKMKKQAGEEALTLEFVKNPDILHHIAMHENRPEFVLGFAAETHDHKKHALQKLHSKQCDAIAMNDVCAENNVFGGDANQLTLFFASDKAPIHMDKASKELIASQLVDVILNI